jgi:hypothetical protein
MALNHGHEKSAFALVRAGADIYQTAPKSLVPKEGARRFGPPLKLAAGYTVSRLRAAWIKPPPHRLPWLVRKLDARSLAPRRETLAKWRSRH